MMELLEILGCFLAVLFSCVLITRKGGLCKLRLFTITPIFCFLIPLLTTTPHNNGQKPKIVRTAIEYEILQDKLYSKLYESNNILEEDSLLTERDKADKAEEERQAIATQRSQEALANPVSKDLFKKSHLNTAKRLIKYVEREEYDRFKSCLNSVALPKGTDLKVRMCEENGIGDISELYVELPDGEKDFHIFRQLAIKPSSSGAWQTYLLLSLESVLPMYWHACYGERTYIFNEADLTQLTQNKIDYYADAAVVDSIRNKKFDLTPTIIGKGDTYYVTCCYWSPFAGLIRECMEVIFKDGKVYDVHRFTLEVLHEYWCGVIF